MKNFFLRLHFLITNPRAFVLSYTTEPKRIVMGYFLMVLTVMVGATSMIRTERILSELPELLSDTFQSVEINDNVLSADSVIVPPRWRISELGALMSGRTTPAEFYPDSMIVVDVSQTAQAPFVMAQDSLVLTFATYEDTTRNPMRISLPWDIVILGGDLSFTNAGLNDYFYGQILQVFVGTLFSTFIATAEDLLTYCLMLLILVLIYRRELKAVWKKQSTIKILINGTMPYFILMPLFAITGNRAELLPSVAIVVSSVIIFRAFHFHRMSLLAQTKRKGKE